MLALKLKPTKKHMDRAKGLVTVAYHAAKSFESGCPAGSTKVSAVRVRCYGAQRVWVFQPNNTRSDTAMHLAQIDSLEICRKAATACLIVEISSVFGRQVHGPAIPESCFEERKRPAELFIGSCSDRGACRRSAAMPAIKWIEHGYTNPVDIVPKDAQTWTP